MSHSEPNRFGRRKMRGQNAFLYASFSQHLTSTTRSRYNHITSMFLWCCTIVASHLGVVCSEMVRENLT
ncbi:hypothetical protein HanXRQr2_Chr06g0273041 [Helianthus annuus]|uniref:Uncharacterized protein n=1 Tax=Helianthus annuus TaxID=4232 RepID=A0A9K3IVK2_HELAN|nr:hypothetical protein HanXRQr2_Chr06g0273041 [Helianthus annuus]KAJ0916599.1 hypothetical protein HanPSC8_Chr06g0263611 [Helianthus annuus]